MRKIEGNTVKLGYGISLFFWLLLLTAKQAYSQELTLTCDITYEFNQMYPTVHTDRQSYNRSYEGVVTLDLSSKVAYFHKWPSLSHLYLGEFEGKTRPLEETEEYFTLMKSAKVLLTKTPIGDYEVSDMKISRFTGKLSFQWQRYDLVGTLSESASLDGDCKKSSTFSIPAQKF